MSGTVRALDDEQIEAIRLMARSKTMRQVDLARKFGVTQGFISKIVNGKELKRAPEPDRLAVVRFRALSARRFTGTWAERYAEDVQWLLDEIRRLEASR